MSRRQLISLVAVVAALLIVGIDVWAVHHFGKNAATKSYPDDYLNAVACPSSAQRWAVGQTASAPGGNTLSEPRDPLLKHETAGHWGTVAVAAPGTKDALEAIACPGTTGCWAVGGNAAGGQAFIEHWTGGAWQSAPSPAVPRRPARRHQLRASPSAAGRPAARRRTPASPVTCSSSGTDPSGQSPRRWPVACARSSSPARGAVTAWPLACETAPPRRPPTPAAAGRRLRRPLPCGRCTGRPPRCSAAPARRMCLAAFGGKDLVTDVWNGSTWTPAGPSMLTYPVGLTCSGARGCWLLGMTRKYRPLALRWQGNDWVAVAVPGAPPRLPERPGLRQQMLGGRRPGRRPPRRRPLHPPADSAAGLSGGANLEVRSRPAARPRAAAVRAILREASSIISPSNIAAPTPSLGRASGTRRGSAAPARTPRRREPRCRPRSDQGAAPTCRRSRAASSAARPRESRRGRGSPRTGRRWPAGPVRPRGHQDPQVRIVETRRHPRNPACGRRTSSDPHPETGHEVGGPEHQRLEPGRAAPTWVHPGQPRRVLDLGLDPDPPGRDRPTACSTWPNSRSSQATWSGPVTLGRMIVSRSCPARSTTPVTSW